MDHICKCIIPPPPGSVWTISTRYTVDAGRPVLETGQWELSRITWPEYSFLIGPGNVYSCYINATNNYEVPLRKLSNLNYGGADVPKLNESDMQLIRWRGWCEFFVSHNYFYSYYLLTLCIFCYFVLVLHFWLLFVFLFSFILVKMLA